MNRETVGMKSSYLVSNKFYGFQTNSSTTLFSSVHKRNVTSNAQGNFNRQKINIYVRGNMYMYGNYSLCPGRKKKRHTQRAFRVPRWVAEWENRGEGANVDG